MKKINFLFIFLSFIILFIVSCNPYGKKKEFGSIEIYYKKGVSVEEVEKLGNYLKNNGWDDGETKTVQLLRSGDIYQVKVVVKKGIDQDPEYISLFRIVANELSYKVFDGKTVEMHMCDENLKTLKIVEMINYGQLLTFDNIELYYTDKVTKEDAENLGKFLLESGFNNSEGTKTVQLTKEGKTYQFRMVVLEGYDQDEYYEEIAREFAGYISNYVFDGKPVEMHLCNDYLETLKVVKI